VSQLAGQTWRVRIAGWRGVYFDDGVSKTVGEKILLIGAKFS
jgi:hypothetical protein